MIKCMSRLPHQLLPLPGSTTTTANNNNTTAATSTATTTFAAAAAATSRKQKFCALLGYLRCGCSQMQGE
jgi:hypothetical protein